MAKKRDPIGPLMDLNVGRHPLTRLQRLANAMRAGGVPLAALDENVTVDEHSGVVTRMMALCGHCQGPCCSTLRIPITRSDARRLAKNLETTVTRLPLLPLDGIEEEQDDLAGYLSKGASPCPYFDRGCRVHSFRPDVCRSFGLHHCIGTGSFVPLARVGLPRGPAQAAPAGAGE
jgi:hypothetical protein